MISPALKVSLTCLKRILCFYIAGALLFSACQSSDNHSEKSLKIELQKRLEGFLTAVGKSDIDSILAYTYPRYFELITKVEASKNMESSYSLFKTQGKIDQVKADSIFPFIYTKDGTYTEVIYSVSLRLNSDTLETPTLPAKTESDTASVHHSIGKSFAAPQNTLMAALLKQQYQGIEFTDIQTTNGQTHMKMKVAAIAAKDSFAKNWSFISVIGDQLVLFNLFPKEVLASISKYNPEN